MSEIRAIIDSEITQKLSDEQLKLKKRLIESSFEMAFNKKDKELVDDFAKRVEQRELKATYNHILKRYYNGCNYIEQHLEEIDKYLPVVQELLNRLNKILEKIPQATEEEILNGFKM